MSGTCLARMGWCDEAIADYTKALELDPYSWFAYVKKGEACEAAGRPQEALEVSNDYAGAVEWYRQAEAQCNLGLMYAEGHGVPQDFVQAHMRFDLAAARFSASEAEERDMAVKSRDDLAAKMTPAQIAEAQRLASEWKPK
ncbi:MAG: tetratricopeptide repeat protein [Pseudomonadota bacterium]